MAEINQELLEKIKAEAEQKKAEKEAKKALRKAKRQMFIQEHKLVLAGAGVGATLLIKKIVADVLKEAAQKKEVNATEDTNAAWRSGYQNGWYDASADQTVSDNSTTEVSATEDTPME